MAFSFIVTQRDDRPDREEVRPETGVTGYEECEWTGAPGFPAQRGDQECLVTLYPAVRVFSRRTQEPRCRNEEVQSGLDRGRSYWKEKAGEVGKHTVGQEGTAASGKVVRVMDPVVRTGREGW